VAALPFLTRLHSKRALAGAAREGYVGRRGSEHLGMPVVFTATRQTNQAAMANNRTARKTVSQ
jgi:hypothetical protein